MARGCPNKSCIYAVVRLFPRQVLYICAALLSKDIFTGQSTCTNSFSDIVALILTFDSQCSAGSGGFPSGNSGFSHRELTDWLGL